MARNRSLSSFAGGLVFLCAAPLAAAAAYVRSADSFASIADRDARARALFGDWIASGAACPK